VPVTTLRRPPARRAGPQPVEFARLRMAWRQSHQGSAVM